jgi:hypothetical protein
MNLLQTPCVQRAVFVCEQILHLHPPPPPSSFYNSNNDIDTKGQTTWCIALLEIAVVTYLVNILIDFAKHRFMVHGKVPKGSDTFRGPPGFYLDG